MLHQTATLNPALECLFQRHLDKPSHRFEYNNVLDETNQGPDLSDVELKALERFLRAHPEISYLSIKGFDDTKSNINLLIQLASLSSITHINLLSSKLLPASINLIARSKIKCIQMNSCGITDEAAISLAGSSLTSLNLGHNAVGLPGAEALARNTSLTELYLNCQTPSLNAAAVRTLVTQSKVPFLNIIMSDAEEINFEELLQENKTLEELDIHQNYKTTRMQAILDRNKTKRVTDQLQVLISFSQIRLRAREADSTAKSSLNPLANLHFDLFLLIMGQAFPDRHLELGYYTNNTREKVNERLTKVIFEQRERIRQWLKERKERLRVVKHKNGDFSLFFIPKKDIHKEQPRHRAPDRREVTRTGIRRGSP